MFQIVIGIGVALILLMLFMMFRVGTLLNVAKGSDKKIASGSNKVNAIMFLVLLIGGFGWMFWYSIVYFDDYTLPVASEHGVITDQLFWVTMVITGLVFVITHILLFVFPIKYHYKKERTAMFYPDNHKLELLWTVVPAIVLAGLVFTGLGAWNDITSEAPEDSEVIEVFGQQFAWVSRYTGADDKLGKFDYRMISLDNQLGVDFKDKNSLDDFIPREIHLPKGKPVLFKIRARDVLHSVYAPHFRLKMDAVPGMPTQFHFVPTKTTTEMREETGNSEFNYELACAEVCGRGHFAMRLLIVVDTPEEYEEWKASQKTLLAQSEELMSLVPDDLKELAKIKAGVEEEVIETPATQESSDNVEAEASL
jgi:cytochrome c oxidase subunit 2